MLRGDVKKVVVLGGRYHKLKGGEVESIFGQKTTTQIKLKMCSEGLLKIVCQANVVFISLSV